MSARRTTREPARAQPHRAVLRADDYVRHRPSYPPGAIDAVLDGLGPPAALRAADVGAGTGISSRLLADRGVRVIAIEPNRAMRDAGARMVSRVEWRDASAEATGLDDASVDLVMCAQAYHWFDPEASLAEFGRVVRARGRLALVWNARDGADPMTRGYVEAIRAVHAQSEAERRPFDPGSLEVGGHFGPARVVRFRNEQTLDADGLVGRARSASYVPKGGEAGAALERSLRDLHALHADADGLVRLIYEARVFLSERRG